jgi:hypothetical protein
LTIASFFYDPIAGLAREFESHLNATRKGSVPNIRRRFRARGIAIVQRDIYRRYGVWVPESKLKGRFEGETPGTRVRPDIRIESRSMRFRGKHWSATRLPSRVVSYSKGRHRVAKKK